MHRKQAVRAASNVNSSESTSKPQKESRISSSVSGIPVLPALALFSWTSLLEFVVVFLSSLSILALTAYPSVSGGDAGELVVTSCNLGVAHPPGYPTFTLWGHLFLTLLPWGTPAWRVNMSVAVLTAVSAAALFATVRLLTQSRSASAAAAFGFLCSPTVWTYAGQGEVFGLNNALHGVLCLTTAAFGATKATSLAAFAAFLCGLLATNQHTSIFTIVPTALAVLFHGSPRRLLQPRRLLPIVGCALFGLSPYLYLPWSSSRGAPDAWGDTASWSGFLRHFLRQEYGTFQLAADVQDTVGLMGRLRVYGSHLLRESLYISVPLALLGLVAAWHTTGGGVLMVATMTKQKDQGVDEKKKASAELKSGVVNADVDGDDDDVAGKKKKSKKSLSFEPEQNKTQRISLLPYRPILEYVSSNDDESSPSASSSSSSSTSLTSPFVLSDPKYRAAVQRQMLRFSLITFVACYTLYVLVFHYLANLDLTPLFLGVQMRFWQQPNLYVFLFAAVGYDTVRVAAMRWSTSSANTQRLIRIGFALMALGFAAVQIKLNWEMNDHHENFVFQNYGRAMLDHLPSPAIVLVNGDINNNAIKYLHQCEGRRRVDVSVLSLQLMSWAWFTPVQAKNYANVTLPGEVYHPHMPNGYSIAQFLEANYHRAPIFLCGPWKEGDDTWRQAGFTTVVFGLCDRVLRKSDADRLDWAAHLKQAVKAVPTTSQLGVWSASKYGEETWERVVFGDSWMRLVHHASMAAYHASQRKDDRALDKTAAAIYDTLLDPDAQRYGEVPADEYRSAGVIYGMMSSYAKQGSAAQTKWSHKMLDAWTQFVARRPDDQEIGRLVRERVNPYIGQLVP